MGNELPSKVKEAVANLDVTWTDKNNPHGISISHPNERSYGFGVVPNTVKLSVGADVKALNITFTQVDKNADNRHFATVEVTRKNGVSEKVRLEADPDWDGNPGFKSTNPGVVQIETAKGVSCSVKIDGVSSGPEVDLLGAGASVNVDTNAAKGVKVCNRVRDGIVTLNGEALQYSPPPDPFAAKPKAAKPGMTR